MTWKLPGYSVEEHTISVPLDWNGDSERTIPVFARVYKRDDAPATTPYMCYMQGGPGSYGPRPESISGWQKVVLERYHLVSFDQRGTGRSYGLDATRIRDEGDTSAQLAFMKCFRADSIVRDAEAMRKHLGLDSWSLFGQSYGGFIISQYLSSAPEHLDGVVYTGGLQHMGLPVSKSDVTQHGEPHVSLPDPDDTLIDQLYRTTFELTAWRCQHYYDLFPDDEKTIRQVCAHVDAVEEYLPTGERLTSERFRQVGLTLGREIGFARLHYLCEEPFIVDRNGKRRLSQRFLNAVNTEVSFADNPLYALMHENIYARQGEAVAWSAARMREKVPGMSASADPTDVSKPYYLTGEHIFPAVFSTDPALDGLADVATALENDTTMPAMYDVDALRDNRVPAVALVYTQDMFVPAIYSRATAQAIGNMTVIEDTVHHHDGIHRMDEAGIRQLLDALKK